MFSTYSTTITSLTNLTLALLLIAVGLDGRIGVCEGSLDMSKARDRIEDNR